MSATDKNVMVNSTEMVDPTIPDDVAESPAEAEARVRHLDEGYLIDFLTGKPIKDTPKEQVRQRIVRVLFHEYQFAPEDIELDFVIQVQTEKGKRRAKIDIAIFAPSSEHTAGNLRRVVVTNKE